MYITLHVQLSTTKWYLIGNVGGQGGAKKERDTHNLRSMDVTLHNPYTGTKETYAHDTELTCDFFETCAVWGRCWCNRYVGEATVTAPGIVPLWLCVTSGNLQVKHVIRLAGVRQFLTWRYLCCFIPAIHLSNHSKPPGKFFYIFNHYTTCELLPRLQVLWLPLFWLPHGHPSRSSLLPQQGIEFKKSWDAPNTTLLIARSMEECDIEIAIEATTDMDVSTSWRNRNMLDSFMTWVREYNGYVGVKVSTTKIGLFDTRKQTIVLDPMGYYRIQLWCSVQSACRYWRKANNGGSSPAKDLPVKEPAHPWPLSPTVTHDPIPALLNHLGHRRPNLAAQDIHTSKPSLEGLQKLGAPDHQKSSISIGLFRAKPIHFWALYPHLWKALLLNPVQFPLISVSGVLNLRNLGLFLVVSSHTHLKNMNKCVNWKKIIPCFLNWKMNSICAWSLVECKKKMGRPTARLTLRVITNRMDFQLHGDGDDKLAIPVDDASISGSRFHSNSMVSPHL